MQNNPPISRAFKRGQARATVHLGLAAQRGANRQQSRLYAAPRRHSLSPFDIRQRMEECATEQPLGGSCVFYSRHESPRGSQAL